MEALGINLPGLIAQIVNFLLLLFLLSRFAFKPLQQMLEQRSERIRESLEAADKARAEAAQSQADIQAQIDSARREGQVIIEQATRASERLREQLLEDARKEADALVVRLRTEFELERDKAVQDMRRQFADLTISAAEKVIKEDLDPAKHQRLINEVLQEARLN